MTCRFSFTELAQRLSEGKLSAAEASDEISKALWELGILLVEQEVPLANSKLDQRRIR